MEPFKLGMMSPAEMAGVLGRQKLCRIAFKTGTHPYIAPFQYVVVDGTVYFHFSAYGRKMKYLEADPDVCVEIEENAPDMTSYKFVVLRGTLVVVDDPGERKAVLDALAKQGKASFSPAFLAAHGFRDEGSWETLGTGKAFVVVKLVDIVEKMGLCSP